MLYSQLYSVVCFVDICASSIISHSLLINPVRGTKKTQYRVRDDRASMAASYHNYDSGLAPDGTQPTSSIAYKKLMKKATSDYSSLFSPCTMQVVDGINECCSQPLMLCRVLLLSYLRSERKELGDQYIHVRSTKILETPTPFNPCTKEKWISRHAHLDT